MSDDNIDFTNDLPIDDTLDTTNVKLETIENTDEPVAPEVKLETVSSIEKEQAVAKDKEEEPIKEVVVEEVKKAEQPKLGSTSPVVSAKVGGKTRHYFRT